MKCLDHQVHSSEYEMDLMVDMTGKNSWVLLLSVNELYVEWMSLLGSLQSTSKLVMAAHWTFQDGMGKLIEVSW